MEERHNGEKNHNEKTSASGYLKNSKNLQFSLQNWQRTISFRVVLSLLLSFWEWWLYTEPVL
jgi:hypothetical protein